MRSDTGLPQHYRRRSNYSQVVGARGVATMFSITTDQANDEIGEDPMWALGSEGIGPV